MNNSIWTQVLSGYVYQLPSLLAGLLGIVFAAMNWQRAPKASLWAMSGFILELGAGLIYPAVQQIVINNRGSVASWAQWLMVAGLFFSLLRGASYVMLLVAIYVGRKEIQPRGFAVLPPPMPGSGMG